MTFKTVFIKEGRLRPTWRVVIYVLAYFLGSIAVQIPIAVFLVLAIGLGAVDESTLLSVEYSLPLLIAVSLANLALILPLTYLFRRFLDGGTLVELGFHRKAGWSRQILQGLLLGALLIGFVFLLEWGAGWLRVSGFAWQAQSPMLIVGNLVGYFVMMTLVAFNEELSYRGYIFQNLNADWGPVVSVVASSVLFGLFHGLNPNVTWLALFNVFLAGVLLAGCYLTTKALWLPMAFHFSWNFVQGPILSFPVSGLATNGLLLTRSGGNPLITGGPFGPEAGLISTGTLGVALLVLFLWRRR